MKSSISEECGFTLLEVLVAFSILAIILVSLYSAFFLSHKAVKGLDESMLRLQECRMALDIMKREIDSSFYKDGDKNTGFKLEDRDNYGKPASRLIFTTLSPLRAGISEVRYYIKESDKKLVLYKAMAPSFGHEKETQEADILEDIEEFIIEAKYGDKWVRTWDSGLLHRLPKEVNISIKVKVKEKSILLSMRARPAIS